MPAAARKIALTDRSLQAMKPSSDGRRAIVWDAIMPGMAVRVSGKGRRTFYAVRRRAGETQPSWLALGAYPMMTLAEAREKAREALTALIAGDDPAAVAEAKRRAKQEAEAKRNAGTFGALAEKYIEQRLPKLRSARSAEALIRRELMPVLGDRPIGEIRRRDIIKLLEGIAARGAVLPDGRMRPKSGGEYAARHAYAAISAMFNWALARDVEGLEANPCARIKAADLFGGAARARHRVLSDDEIRWVWQAAEARGGDPFGVLYQILLMTGQRLTEIAHARWGEIDPVTGTLTVSAERMKGKAAHTVPLTSAVVSLLGTLPRFAGGDFIFTTTAGRRPISGFSRAQARMRAAVERLAAPASVPHWQIHDLRRSARTGLSTTGATPFIAELVVAHVQSGVHGVYDLFKYDAEKRDALERWERRLMAIVGGPEAGNVVPMRVRA